MRLVQVGGPGVVELNWTWLPTWLGQNTILKQEIEAHITEWMKQKESPVYMDDSTLDEMHDEVMSFLRAKFPEPKGLMDYLEGLGHVHIGD